jgi:hypothetical protein
MRNAEKTREDEKREAADLLHDVNCGLRIAECREDERREKERQRLKCSLLWLTGDR